MVTAELVLTPLSRAVDSVLVGLCGFLLFLLGLYIFFISPRKSKLIKKQKQRIFNLECKNARLKNKLSPLINE